MNVRITSELTSADIAILESIYMSSFPEDERRPWHLICHPEKNAGPKLYAILADGHIAGVVTLWRFEHFAYIEHLAIDSSLRGYGIGSDAIKCIIDKIGRQPLVVEIEPPSDERPETVSRHKFYRHLGFETIDTTYIQPPYAEGLRPVALHLMATTILPAASTTRTLHSEVYNS